MSGARYRKGLPLLLAALLPGPALAAPDPMVGEWRAAEGPDMASRLAISADHRFTYEMIYGALDEAARGTWERVGATIHLTTQPKPTPSTIVLREASPRMTKNAPLSLTVLGPDAKQEEDGIAGVDFRIEFDRGAPVEGYTQYYGWQADTLDGRTPLWVQMFEPIHHVLSERVAIPPGTHTLVFTFQPHDFGIVDFEGAEVRLADGKLVLRHPRGGDLHYVPAHKGR